MQKLTRAIGALGLSVAASAAFGQSAQGVVPEMVMTGNSSAFADGVWVRVSGQVGHVNCYYAPLNVSLFYAYARANSPMDPKKALALLMAAKLGNRLVNIEFASDGVQADFWGYGISRCEIQRLTLN